MDVTLFLLQIGVMLAMALLFGQLMRHFGQPAVMGELIGGVVLGPTVFGLLFPGAYQRLFPPNEAVAFAREGLITIGMLFFLFIAGLEVSPSRIRQSGSKVLATSVLGMALPFALGFGLVWLFPALWGPPAVGHRLSLALFIGVALSITALPVIARILGDLGLMQDELGAVVMSAAIVNDLIGWALFAVILGSFAPQSAIAAGSPGVTLALAAAFALLVVLGGRALGPGALHWIRRRLPWPSAFITVTAILILVIAAGAEAIGMHAVLGAFLVGVALSQRIDEQNQAHEVIYQFAISFFAPLYFVAIGLRVNFAEGFDFWLVVAVLAVACIGKIAGAGIGAWLGGMAPRRALAVGFGMNARGAIELILATVALEHGLIDQRIFVALVFMAIATSLMSGPAMKRLAGAPRR